MSPSSSLRSRSSLTSLQIPSTTSKRQTTAKEMTSKKFHGEENTHNTTDPATPSTTMDCNPDGAISSTGPDTMDIDDDAEAGAPEPKDVIAPSSDYHNSDFKDQSRTATAMSKPEAEDDQPKSWTGPKDTPPCENEAQKVDADNSAVLNDMNNYDLASDGSDNDSVNAVDVERDDDYGGVDNISDLSDNSKAFELDFETHVQEFVDDGSIDLGDPNMFDYNPDFRTGHYDICDEDGMLRSMIDFEQSQQTSMPQPELTMSNLVDRGVLGSSRPVASRLGSNSSFGSSWNTTTTTASPSPRKQSIEDLTPLTSSLTSSHPTDGDETDDDEEYRTSYRPAFPVSAKDDGMPKFRFVDDANLPPPVRGKQTRPKMKKFTADRKLCRAIRHAAMRNIHRTSLATSKPVGLGSLSLQSEWESVASDSSDSGMHSPTMIDFEDAMANGNMNSGAQITDGIRGAIFAEMHCRSPGEGRIALPSHNSFMERMRAQYSPVPDYSGIDASFGIAQQADVEFEAMIDVEECGEPSSSEPSPLPGMAQLAQPFDPTIAPPSFTSDTSQFIGSQEDATTPDYEHSAMDSSAISPQATQLLAPPFSPISPKKRRLSERSNGEPVRGMQKRSRFGDSDSILLSSGAEAAIDECPKSPPSDGTPSGLMTSSSP